MKWRTNQPGERRTRRRFAWLPRRLDTGVTIWFERYWVVQEFYVVDSIHVYAEGWKHVKDWQ